jgi:hypothetical protein
MSVFYDSDGGAWKRIGVDTSDVGKRLNIEPLKEPGNCFICEVLDDVETPATAHSMVDSDNGAEPTIFSMMTCALHTARWDYRSPRVTHDGETQRGA